MGGNVEPLSLVGAIHESPSGRRTGRELAFRAPLLPRRAPTGHSPRRMNVPMVRNSLGRARNNLARLPQRLGRVRKERIEGSELRSMNEKEPPEGSYSTRTKRKTTPRGFRSSNQILNRSASSSLSSIPIPGRERSGFKQPRSGCATPSKSILSMRTWSWKYSRWRRRVTTQLG